MVTRLHMKTETIMGWNISEKSCTILRKKVNLRHASSSWCVFRLLLFAQLFYGRISFNKFKNKYRQLIRLLLICLSFVFDQIYNSLSFFGRWNRKPICTDPNGQGASHYEEFIAAYDVFKRGGDQISKRIFPTKREPLHAARKTVVLISWMRNHFWYFFTKFYHIGNGSWNDSLPEPEIK